MNPSLPRSGPHEATAEALQGGGGSYKKPYRAADSRAWGNPESLHLQQELLPGLQA